jgi:hypothetical protein
LWVRIISGWFRDAVWGLDQRLTARRPQYRIVIRHSIGAEVTERAFLTAKRRRLSVMSASNPKKNVRAERAKPMMVKYWKCQP